MWFTCETTSDTLSCSPPLIPCTFYARNATQRKTESFCSNNAKPVSFSSRPADTSGRGPQKRIARKANEFMLPGDGVEPRGSPEKGRRVYHVRWITVNKAVRRFACALRHLTQQILLNHTMIDERIFQRALVAQLVARMRFWYNSTRQVAVRS